MRPWWVVPALALRRDDAAFLRRDRDPPREAWDYAEHGANWPGACADQTGQSPIALPALATVANETRKFFYKYDASYEEELVMYNDGFLITGTFGHDKKVGGIGIGGDFQDLDMSWSLQQVTLHAPSEHTWGGTHLPAELQLVHSGETAEEGLAVVSIGLRRGQMQTTSTFWDTLIGEGLPVGKLAETRVNRHYPDRLDFNTVVGNKEELGSGIGGPDPRDEENWPEFFVYTGSVTVPPCTPGVHYFVKAEPMDVHPTQLEQIIDAIARTMAQPDGNFRITRPLGDRNITKVRAENAEGKETREEMLERTASPTVSPVVNLTSEHPGYDPSHYDAVVETDTTKMSFQYNDPTAQLVAANKQAAKDADGILGAFPHDQITSDPDAVVDQMPKVVAKQSEIDAEKVELTTKQQEMDRAQKELLAAKQIRTWSEGYDNVTLAESQVLTMQNDYDGKVAVVASVEKKIEVLEQELGQEKATAHGEVWAAQQAIEAINKGETASAATTMPMSFTLPTGSAADPFSRHNAETVSRVTEKPLPRHLTPALGPNHPYVWGTVAMTPAGDGNSTGLESETAVGSSETTLSGGVIEPPHQTSTTTTVQA